MLTFSTLYAKPTIESEKSHFLGTERTSHQFTFPVPLSSQFPPTIACMMGALHRILPIISFHIKQFLAYQYLPSWLTVYVTTCCRCPLHTLAEMFCWSQVGRTRLENQAGLPRPGGPHLFEINGQHLQGTLH